MKRIDLLSRGDHHEFVMPGLRDRRDNWLIRAATARRCFRFQAAARPMAWMPTIAMFMPAAGIHRICRAKALRIIDCGDPAHATTVATFQLPSFSDAQLRIAEWRLSYDQLFRAAVAMLLADD
jgi:hypothetical protein